MKLEQYTPTVYCFQCGHPFAVSAPPPAIDHAESFVWWRKREYGGGTFPYECCQCNTTVELRQRVTLVGRSCPGCGFPITRDKIDRQLDEMEPKRQQIIEDQKQRQQIIEGQKLTSEQGERSGCLPWIILLAILGLVVAVFAFIEAIFGGNDD
jgi:hypothetical protein